MIPRPRLMRQVSAKKMGFDERQHEEKGFRPMMVGGSAKLQVGVTKTPKKELTGEERKTTICRLLQTYSCPKKKKIKSRKKRNPTAATKPTTIDAPKSQKDNVEPLAAILALNSSLG